MPIRLYDSLTRSLRELKPAQKDGVFRFYNCGPTVYAPAHIGNFRTFVVNDATAIDGNLAQSSLAVVNSYKAADGTQVATRIEAVNVTSLLFLPNLSKR